MRFTIEWGEENCINGPDFWNSFVSFFAKLDRLQFSVRIYLDRPFFIVTILPGNQEGRKVLELEGSRPSRLLLPRLRRGHGHGHAHVLPWRPLSPPPPPLPPPPLLAFSISPGAASLEHLQCSPRLALPLSAGAVAVTWPVHTLPAHRLRFPRSQGATTLLAMPRLQLQPYESSPWLEKVASARLRIRPGKRSCATRYAPSLNPSVQRRTVSLCVLIWNSRIFEFVLLMLGF